MLALFAQIRGYLLFLLAMSYLAHVLFGWLDEWLIIGLTVLTFLASMPFMARLSLAMALGMIILGQFFFIRFSGDWSFWKTAVTQNLPFIALFVSMPLLSLPFRAGNYENYVSFVLRRFYQNSLWIYTLVAGSSMLLTSFMNIGSMRVIVELFGKEIERRKEMFVKSIIQGFSLAVILSPYIAGVAVVLYILREPLVPFIFFAIPVAAAGLVVTSALFYMDRQRLWGDAAEVAVTTELATPQMRANHRKGIELIAALFVLFGAVVVLEDWLRLNLIVVISLIALTFPFIWIMFIGKMNLVPRFLNQYRKEVLPNIHNESILIVSASFFSSTVQFTPAAEYIAKGVGLVASQSLFAAVFLMLALPVLLAIVGVHQILPVTILAATVPPERLGLQPVLMALALTTGWALAVQMSPITALNILSCRLFGLRSWQLARWNWKFVFCMILLTSIMIYLLHFMLR